MTAILAERVVTEKEQRMVLSPITWKQYEALLQVFPEHAGLRVTFLDGRITLLSPTRRHDWFEKILGRFVEAIAESSNIELEVSGHTTYRRDDLDAGVEGDQAYYFGANARTMRGPIPVDLATQPPPDLTIEVEALHSADDSIAVWGRLGVREVWRINVTQSTVCFMVRRDDGSYEASTRSKAFPTLEPIDLLLQLELAEKLGWSMWVGQLNEWVRTVLLPRNGS